MKTIKKITGILIILGVLTFPSLTQAASISISDSTLSVTEDQSVSITEVTTLIDDNKGGLATQLNGAFGIDIVGDYAYVTSFSDNSLSIIDISDPSNPTELGTIKDGVGATDMASVYDVEVLNGLAYVTGTADDAFSIINVSDPSNPTEVAVLKDEVNATSLNYVRHLEVRGDFVYATAYHDDALVIIDVSSSTNPVEIGVIKHGVGATNLDGANDIRVVGDYAYVTSRFVDSFSIIDISSSTNPTEISSVVGTSNGGTATALDGAYSVEVRGDYAYVGSVFDTSLTIFDVSNPASPMEVSVTDLPESPAKMHLIGDYLYVLTYNTISILDVSDPTSPIEVQTITDGSGTEHLEGDGNLKIANGYIYAVSAVDDSLSIFQTSGKLATYDIILDTAPTSDVIVSVTSSDTTTGVTVSPSTLTFTPENWHKPQQVSVTAVDDGEWEGVLPHEVMVAHSVSSADANYNNFSLSDVTVEIAENELRPLGNIVNLSGGQSNSATETDEEDGGEESDEDADVEEEEEGADQLTEEEKQGLQKQINEARELIRQLILLIQTRFGIVLDIDL